MKISTATSTPDTMSRSQTPDNMSETSDYADTRHSSVSSESSEASASSAHRALQSSALANHPPALSHSVPGLHKPAQVDPLSRVFPKPAQEINVLEALAREPLKWSLGHYIKKAPMGDLDGQIQDKEKAARDKDAKKRLLMEAKEEIRRLSLPK